MELHAKYVRAYSRSCIGCQLHNKDIMLSYQEESQPSTSPFTDVFLTQEMAVDLHEELGRMIALNKIKEEVNPTAL